MATQEREDITITEDRGASRYEARVDGKLAGFLQYERQGDHVTLIHTEVDPVFEGHGIGGALARAALDEARDARLVVVPRCPFVREYITRHHEYLEIVEPHHREQIRRLVP